jgi:hypothetical protein
MSKILKKDLQTKGFDYEYLDISSIITSITEAKPICLVGNPKTGKSKFLKYLTTHLNMMPVYFNPDNIGTFREVYGVYDPISISQ